AFPMRSFLVLLFGSLFTPAATAAEKLVLVAGGSKEAVKVPAVEAKLKEPFGVDFDKAGNLYLVELGGQRMRVVESKGDLHLIAGTGGKGNEGDGGPAEKATFNGMHSLAVGPDGAIYLADTWNNRVRRFAWILGKEGTIQAFAGTGKKGFSGDGGPAEKAEFGGIYCVSLDPAGRRLLLPHLDSRRHRGLQL